MFRTWPRQAAFIRHENRLRLVLNPLRTVSISDWDSGLSVTLEGPGQMPLCLPSLNIQLIKPEYPKPVAQPISEFARHIPSQIRELAAPYRWKQFSLLQLCSRSQHVVELMQTLPMLAWLLADATDASNDGVKASCALATKKRARMLASLGVRGTKSHVRLLQKCLPKKHDFAELNALLSALRSERLTKALGHAERINLSALAAVIDCPDLIELPFVREELSSAAASYHRLQLARMLLKGCARFSGHYSQADFRQLLQRCRSFEDLRDRYNQLHDRFNLGLARQRGCVQQEEACQAVLQHKIQRYDEHRGQRLLEMRRQQELECQRRREQRLHARRLAEQRLEAAEQQALRELDQQRARGHAQHCAPSAGRTSSPFPPPPLPGNEYIQPLTTPEELRSEGQRMQNCVGDGPYDLDVRKGKLYIYRVLSPQRCTLEIKINSSGRLSIGQLKTRGNASPGQATKKFVQDWLHGRHDQKPQAQPPAAPTPRPRPGQGKLL